VCSPKTRSVPDYDDRCTYFTKEWAKVDEVSSSGIGTAVEFPTAVVSGQRRAGARTETLHLDFVGGKSCDWSASPGDRKETAWRGLSDGAVLAVELRARSGDVVCSSAIP
jgi:hypothetical protein